MEVNSSKFKHTLEQHPARKGTCPKCEKPNVFRHYDGFGKEYGVCERLNNCGYKNKPYEGAQFTPRPSTPPLKLVLPAVDYFNKIVESQNSNFHFFATKTLNIPSTHLLKWNCGAVDGDTAFVYQDRDQRYLNLVRIAYLLIDSTDCKRDKSKMPFSLKAKPGEKYSLCLFGEHLLVQGKTICLVESEKTAVVASYHYPQFNWLATGGANKLTDEKVKVLSGYQVYYICDADKAGKENSTLRKLQYHKIDFKVLDLFPERNDGYDLADALIAGLRPDLTPKSTVIVDERKTVKKMEGSKLSVFEKVENYLNENFEIRFNEVSNEIESRDFGTSEPFKPLIEVNIYRLLKHNHIRISQSDVTALLRSEFVPTYNPLADYFNGLGEWTMSEPDYIEQLCTYVPVKDPERFARHFKKMLVRCIACGLSKVYNKQAFVFIHDEQNSGKSTFCRWLCPPALENYIAENISTDKDSLIALTENFLINMDELATLNKSEINSLKAMFSRDVVKVRRPFERKAATTLRRANFVGSTNKTEFLTDETGSVRWLCFELTGKLNWNYKQEIDINKVWKQAYTLYREGFRYELTPDEVRENDQINRSYQVQTTEMDLIQKHYLPGTKEDHQVFHTATDILSNLSDKCSGSVRLNTNNIGKALKFLGFTQSSERMKSPYPVKGYYLKFVYD